MYSQKLLNLSYAYIYSNNQENTELDYILSEWKSSHDFLTDCYQNKFNLYNNSIDEGLTQLQPYIDYASDMIISRQFDIDSLTENQEAFLTNMNEIVNAIETNSKKKLHLIITIEIILAIISLCLLYYEVNSIFKPIIGDLEKSNTSITKSNDLLKKYAYLASHNFKSPVRIISSYLGLLEKKHKNNYDDDDKLYYSYINDAAKNLQDVSKDLVLFSEIYTQKANLQKIDITSLYHEVIAEAKVDENTITIDTIDVSKSIRADLKLLKIAITNVVNNSLKFRDEKTDLQIKLGHQLSNGYDVLTIEDNGIGIDSTFKDKAFGLFEKLHSSELYGGNGIGLAICENIVDKHQGIIELKRLANKGTLAAIKLPV